MAQSYEAYLVASGKKPAMLVTERVHLKQWRESVGYLTLDKLRPGHVSWNFGFWKSPLFKEDKINIYATRIVAKELEEPLS